MGWGVHAILRRHSPQNSCPAIPREHHTSRADQTHYCRTTGEAVAKEILFMFQLTATCGREFDALLGCASFAQHTFEQAKTFKSNA